MSIDLEKNDNETNDRDSGNSLSKIDALRMLGSLKLTVILFAFSLLIVLVGTLAQDEMNMVEVKARYFTSWIAKLHIDDLFPKAFFPHDSPIAIFKLAWIPVPGGALIGFLLMANLIAAKATRFKIHAKGNQLVAGSVAMLIGAAIAAAVIFTGHSSDGLQGTPPMEYSTLWKFILASCAGGAFAAFTFGINHDNMFFRCLMLATTVGLAVFVVYSLVTGFRIGDPGLRIVWQLTKGLGAGIVMLIGCQLLFNKQGGNVLLHMGIALLMAGQFHFGDRQLEQRLSLVEGESTNTLINLDKIELTFSQFIDDEEKVIAIPGSRLRAAKKADLVIKDASLPVDIRVLEFYENHRLGETPADNQSPADEPIPNKGLGLKYTVESLRKHGGTDSEMNVAAAHVELLDKESGESLGIHLVSQMLSNGSTLFPGQNIENEFDSATIAEQEYKLGLQFHREVKPYWVQLEDVRRINYSGTETPRDYSSFIRIVDPVTGEDRRERVWMNNPLRFRGESMFQSSYTELSGGKEMTGIQVVRNSGWLIPYVACSITALGMLAHFWGTLTRFVRRREREARNIQRSGSANGAGVGAAILAGVMALVFLVPWGTTSKRESDRNGNFDFYTAGRMPVSFGGRVMPLDAFARQTLKALSNRESLYLKIVEDAYEVKKTEDDTTPDVLQPIRDRVGGKKISAVQWLMEIAAAALPDGADTETINDLPMIRIDSNEVREELKLPRRSSKLYSLREIQDNEELWIGVSAKLKAIRQKDSAEWQFKDKKLIELENRLRQYRVTEVAMQLPTPPRIPPSMIGPNATAESVQLMAFRALQGQMETIQKMPAPRLVPPSKSTVDDSVDEPDWTVFSTAFFEETKAQFSGGKTDANEVVKHFASMIRAYSTEDTKDFNEAVDNALAAAGEYPIPGYSVDAVALERRIQSNSPTHLAWIMYIMSLVLGLIALVSGNRHINIATWSFIAVVVCIHTYAIFCRIYITGRAPVINIYSSAVFIGWAIAIGGLIVEKIFQSGIGNIVAAAGGLLTLQVAYGLSSGDTMPVLQAVLDTQFWLATHVICVSLGYVATLLAGVLGAVYLLGNWIGKDAPFQKSIYRACYGTACFGILFSFVGTVLGGLWADDSWGRFWGWDPKENGALLIVIWNALVLHARWDGMVGARGFSILAIGGNIITAWSWFGTNELGIGLHSYGFTQGVLMWLTIFIASQLALIGAGLIFWRETQSTVSKALHGDKANELLEG